MRKFGLLGKNIDYSFSKTYFQHKFKSENITDASYENFDIESLKVLPEILSENTSLCGFNVTIPYKEAIIPYLDKLSQTAKKIGAVNTVKKTKKGTLIGYNTDAYGFKKAIEPYLKPHLGQALVLGTGGASKAVLYSLQKLGISYTQVSRSKKPNTITYAQLNKTILKTHLLVINTTPLGTFPDTNAFPEIPYHHLTKHHFLYDLIYNPAETQFLKKGKTYGCKTLNGKEMLIFQAEKAWRIWNK